MTDSPINSPLLEMEEMIGFNGSVAGGHIVHPAREHFVYSVGSSVIVENINSKKQEILTGHTNNVSCLAVSKSGRYLASGQITHMGFKADIYIWDFQTRSQYAKLTLHRVKVQSLSFSQGDKYLVSLGGEDDGSVVVWDIATKDAICGAPAQVMSAGATRTVACSNKDDDIFVTGGEGTLRVWKLDVLNRKIWPTEVNLGKIKRTTTCVEFEPDDSFFYIGTITGDIFAINMSTKIFQLKGPKVSFELGVTALRRLTTGDFLVGSGNGTIAVVKGKDQEFKRTNKAARLEGAVTSIALRGQGHQFYVGTNGGNIYKFSYAEFTHELFSTSHTHAINDVAFPASSSSLFVTASNQNARIWRTSTNQELLRINVPNMTCNALDITQDGKTILTGWDDSRIRGFYPESGKFMFTVENAHHQEVTALASYSDSHHIVSGGGEGSLNVWRVAVQQTAKGQIYTVNKLFTLKEHKNRVSCIKLRKNNEECVSSSWDGSCIVWDLLMQSRKQMIRVNTLFNYVCYHPAEHQLITTGSDRKIGYWETYDGSMIREIDGSTGAINAMDVSGDGKYFVSGGDDKLIKVWLYEEGEVTHMGIGHSAAIKRVKISPDERLIISVSEDGAILRWKFPFAPF